MQRILMVEPIGRRLVGKPNGRRDDNTKANHSKMAFLGSELNGTGSHRLQWRTLVLYECVSKSFRTESITK
jgi:hypothetical protein